MSAAGVTLVVADVTISGVAEPVAPIPMTARSHR